MGITHSEYLRYSLFWFRIRDFMLNNFQIALEKIKTKSIS